MSPCLKSFIFILPVLVASSLLWAQSPVQASPFPTGKSIDSRMDYGLFDLLGGGINYSIDGKPISRYEDFKSLIYPLRDKEASDLIRESEEMHSAAWVLYVSGGLTSVDVALAFKPVPLIGVDWFDRITTGVVAGEIFWGIGALLDGNADSRKYNAVQRYNHLVQKKDDAFWGLRPEIQLAQGGFFFDVGRDF